MNSLATAGIRLVESEGAAGSASSESGGLWLPGIGLGWQAGAASLVVVLALVALRRGLRRSGLEEERAFAAMCRRLKLGAKHAALVRRLAAGIGAAPVALLISETAFERAVRTAGRVVESAGARRTALEVRARVFAG